MQFYTTHQESDCPSHEFKVLHLLLLSWTEVKRSTLQSIFMNCLQNCNAAPRLSCSGVWVAANNTCSSGWMFRTRTVPPQLRHILMQHLFGEDCLLHCCDCSVSYRLEWTFPCITADTKFISPPVTFCLFIQHFTREQLLFWQVLSLFVTWVSLGLEKGWGGTDVLVMTSQQFSSWIFNLIMHNLIIIIQR